MAIDNADSSALLLKLRFLFPFPDQIQVQVHRLRSKSSTEKGEKLPDALRFVLSCLTTRGLLVFFKVNGLNPGVSVVRIV